MRPFFFCTLEGRAEKKEKAVELWETAPRGAVRDQGKRAGDEQRWRGLGRGERDLPKLVSCFVFAYQLSAFQSPRAHTHKHTHTYTRSRAHAHTNTHTIRAITHTNTHTHTHTLRESKQMTGMNTVLAMYWVVVISYLPQWGCGKYERQRQIENVIICHWSEAIVCVWRCLSVISSVFSGCLSSVPPKQASAGIHYHLAVLLEIHSQVFRTAETN
jgi:hypothetical protein